MKKYRILRMAIAVCTIAGVLMITLSTCAEQDENSQFAAAVGNMYYPSLSDAVAAVATSDDEDAAVIVLLKDDEGAGINLDDRRIQDKTQLTIDFNGHTYTCSGGTANSDEETVQGFCVGKEDSITLQNGTILADEGNDSSVLLINYGDLTLENMSLIGSARTERILSCNSGNTVLENVNISGVHNDLIAIDLMHWLCELYGESPPTMRIHNTSANMIDGAIDVYCYGLCEDGSAGEYCTIPPEMQIEGGCFTEDVSCYIDEQHTCRWVNGIYCVFEDSVHKLQ